MQDRHDRNLDQLDAFLKDAPRIEPQLSAAEFAQQVAGHLARLRTQPVHGAVRRPTN